MSDHTQPGPSPDEPARPEFNPPLPDDPDERARRLVESVGGAVLRLDNRARQQEEGRRRRARADLDEKRRTVPPPPRGGDRAGPPLLNRLRMSGLAGTPIPVRKWAWGEWIPKGKATLLSGAGGGGKTTLACQLCASNAIGAAFLGQPVDKGRSLALLAEDDEDDAHRMLANLADYLGRDLGDFDGFDYLARAGLDNALVYRSRSGQIAPTPLYAELQTMILDLGTDLLLLDNARHVCRLNENDGAEVTAAWTLLHALMRETGGTTILAGHTPKNNSAEFSGNAAWENFPRCRLFLGPAKVDDDGEPIENDPRRILRRGKANANGTASLGLVWERGAFRLEHPEASGFAGHLDRMMRAGQAQQAFLDALAALTEQRRHVSHSLNGRNFAPRVIQQAGLAAGFTLSELTAAMNDLFKAKRIVAAVELWRGPDRHPVIGIGRCE